jgi:hypothetical protein
MYIYMKYTENQAKYTLIAYKFSLKLLQYTYIHIQLRTFTCALMLTLVLRSLLTLIIINIKIMTNN